MKRLVFCILLLTALMLYMAPSTDAASVESLSDAAKGLSENVGDDALEDMEKLGVGGIDVTGVNGLSVSDTLGVIGQMLASSATGPMASCAILIAVIVLSSLLEAYTFSLRYVDTKDVMNAVSSLMIIAALVAPLTQLIGASLDTVRGAASLMLAFVPVMIGIMAFSGHVVSSGGYCATVMAASQGLAQLSAVFFAPLLNIYLALSVSSAISERVRLNGICELISRLMKWSLAFAMSVFTAILSVQGIAANAADSVASRAVRFTLSSFIPIIGSSVSEAYKTIQGSVNLLRSGVGVFVILAVIVSFLPHILKVLLWRLSVELAKTVAETFGVQSAVTVLTSVSNVLSVLTAVIICSCSVFLISAGVLLAVGGAS